MEIIIAIILWFTFCGYMSYADNRTIARADVDAMRHREIMDALHAIEKGDPR